MYKHNAQDCLNKLCTELLGKDYYIVDPVGVDQANEIITEEIIRMYKRITFKEKIIIVLENLLSKLKA